MTHHRSPAGGRAGRMALGLLLAGLLSVLAAPASASADASLSCRASAARVTALSPASPIATVEPVRANAPSTPCATQSAETLKPTKIGPIGADALEAYTVSRTGGGSSLAGASKPTIDLGALKIGVQAVQASADVSCVSGHPVLRGTSRVVGLTINGTTITIPNNDAPLNILGVIVRLNEQTVSNGQLTQRAVHVTLPGVAEAVLAEATVAGSDAACATKTDTTPPGGPRICPKGAEFDTATGLCVIRLPGTDRVIVVGPPYTGPSGGTVLPLPEARKRYSSSCLFGPGPQYAVVGTNGADKITGTNRPDRILLLAGNDQADAGRSKDCVDGGSGRDLVAGGLANDRLYGGSGADRLSSGDGSDRAWGGSGNDLVLGAGGNDVLHGNTGNDRVLGEAGNDVEYGDAGNDQVRAGYGHDRLYGGTGNDFLGAFLLGPTVRIVDGGPGRDTAWVNAKEVRVTHHVERIRIFGKRR